MTAAEPFVSGLWQGDIGVAGNKARGRVVLDLFFAGCVVHGHGVIEVPCESGGEEKRQLFLLSGSFERRKPFALTATLAFAGGEECTAAGFRTSEDGGVFGQCSGGGGGFGSFAFAPAVDESKKAVLAERLKAEPGYLERAGQCLARMFPDVAADKTAEALQSSESGLCGAAEALLRAKGARAPTAAGDDDGTKIAAVMELGFGEDQARQALRATAGNVELACELLLDEGEEDIESTSSDEEDEDEDVEDAEEGSQ